VIETSRGGVFVEPGDDEQLATTVLELSNDRARTRQMGANAREYLVRHLDRRDRLDETLRFLQSLVKA
jgi:glycosyltransferase involved in cell wall biosynthesis